jgi:hypothetical protein
VKRWVREVAEAKAEGKAEGKAEREVGGEARALLLLLDVRGIAVPDDARARIAGCRDLAQLEQWLRRAAASTTADEIFR